MYEMKFHFPVYRRLSSRYTKKAMRYLHSFQCFSICEKNIALFEGYRDSPACPSNKKRIRIKINMGSGGMILRGENGVTLRCNLFQSHD
jgi:hypothetical protein